MFLRLLTSYSITNWAQNQVGIDIDGKAEVENSGLSASLFSDGTYKSESIKRPWTSLVNLHFLH